MDELTSRRTVRLQARIARIDGEGPPLRQLLITVAVQSPLHEPICVLDSWIRVETASGIGLAEGKLLHMEHALAFPPLVQPEKEATAKIAIPLSAATIHRLEELRGGSDLELRIHSKLLASEVRESPTASFTAPIQTILEDARHTGFIQHPIPQSEWVKLLKTLGWTEIAVLEIPTAQLRGDQRLVRAAKRLEDAQDCFRRGLWEESIANCRKVFEALIKDVGGKDTMAGSEEVINSIISPPAKAKMANDIILALTDLAHIARHEQLPHIPINRADAALVLHITAALIAYFGAQ